MWLEPSPRSLASRSRPLRTRSASTWQRSDRAWRAASTAAATLTFLNNRLAADQAAASDLGL